MLDIDFSCEGCLREAIERRFLFYPNHEAARVGKLHNEDTTCTICKGNTAKYAVSIFIGSLRKDLIDKRIPEKETKKGNNKE